MEIITAKRELPANPYTEDVAALVAATEANTDPEVVVQGAIKVKAEDANKSRVKFAQAANHAGKTAKLHTPLDELTADEEGNVTLIFSLTKLHQARRGKAKTAEAEAPAAEVAEAPAAEVEVEAPAEVKTPAKPRGRR